MALGAAALGVAYALAAGTARAASLTGDALETLELETVASGLTQPTDVAPLPDGSLVIVERMGDVVIVRPDGTRADVVNHIDVNSTNDEQGLLGVVVDSDFESNRRLFLYASMGDSIPDRHKVLRAELDVDNQLGALETLVDKGLMGFSNHAGGGLFIFEHQLYFSVGDAGGNNAVPPSNQLGTCLNSANGKILRINLDGSIPSDNPLVGLAAVTGCEGISKPMGLYPPEERVYAWGLRNPFRFSIDPLTGLLWVADVGNKAREELSVGGKGSDFGWPFYEGSVYYTQAEQPFQPDGACEGVVPPGPCVPPAFEYTQQSNRNSIIGGPVLELCDWPELWRSRYLFGDNGSGEVWTLDISPERTGVVADSLKPFASLVGPASFRIGPDHALYLVDVEAGEVHRVRPRAGTSGGCELSALGGAGGSSGAAIAASGDGGADSVLEPGRRGGEPTGDSVAGGQDARGTSDREGEGDSVGGSPTHVLPSSKTGPGAGCGCQVPVESEAALAYMLVLAAPLLRRARRHSTSKRAT